MEARKRLRQLVDDEEILVLPGAYDALSARLAEAAGFPCVYMTGYGQSASKLGQPDVGLMTMSEMVARASNLVECCGVPVIADADTGFGGLLNVRETVRGYESAGVQAIQIEDQEMPKKCGHTPNRRVVPLADAVRRIEVAVDARRRDDTLIIARTDARTGLGLDEAIRRGQAFARAGADIVFIEAPESADEFRRVGESIDAWLLANMVPSGKSPEIAREDLQAWGFDIAIYPSAGMGVVCAALERNYQWLKANGRTAGSPVPAFDMRQLHELVGFDEVWAFEKRYVETGSGEKG